MDSKVVEVETVVSSSNITSPLVMTGPSRLAGEVPSTFIQDLKLVEVETAISFLKIDPSLITAQFQPRPSEPSLSMYTIPRTYILDPKRIKVETAISSLKINSSLAIPGPSCWMNEAPRTFHPFPKLSTELQLMILEKALVSNEALVTYFCPDRLYSERYYQKPSSFDYPLKFNVNGLAVNILATSKDMHCKGLELFYGKNTFMVIQKDAESSRPGDCVPTEYVMKFLEQRITVYDGQQRVKDSTIGSMIKHIVFSESAIPLKPDWNVNFIEQNVEAAIYAMLSSQGAAHNTPPVTLLMFADRANRVKLYIDAFEKYSWEFWEKGLEEMKLEKKPFTGKLVIVQGCKEPAVGPAAYLLYSRVRELEKLVKQYNIVVEHASLSFDA